jgi:CheY-like chemotaxis protein
MSKPVILCVDGAPDILNTLKMQLKQEFKDNYFYELAESGDEALEIVEDFQEGDRRSLHIYTVTWKEPT